MSISSTLVTDDWRYIDIGDFGDVTEDLIKKGLSGTATFTPVGLTGVSVDGTPEDWYVVARPRTARYTLGRLVGGDGVKGIRLVSSVDGNPVVWQVERELRWNGQTIPGIDPVTVIFSGEANHLPEMDPVAGDSGNSVTEAVVAVSQLIIAAQEAAGRAESAATTAVDADEDAQQARSDTLAARQDAQDAAIRAQAGADRVGTAEAVLDAAARTDQSAADADAAAVRAETAATDAEGVATAAATTAATAAVAHVVGTAPENLDTLGEIAEKLSDQDDVAAVLTTQIAGKAGKAHTHTMAQVTGLDDALAERPTRAEVNARPAMFSGEGEPPESIPGAVVGDWWLNTTTMELSKITGV